MTSFLKIDKTNLKRKLRDEDAEVIDVPAKYAKKSVHEDIKAVRIKDSDKLAPYLYCAKCGAMILWLRLKITKSQM